MKASRVHFQAVDDLLLLREVVSFEQPLFKELLAPNGLLALSKRNSRRNLEKRVLIH